MNQMVRSVVSPDVLCAQLQDSMRSMLTRTTLSPDDAVSELASLYRSHLLITGEFERVTLSTLSGIAFSGTICGERRMVSVY